MSSPLLVFTRRLPFVFQVQSIIALSKLIKTLKLRGGLATASTLCNSLRDLERLAELSSGEAKRSKKDLAFQQQVKDHCETLVTILDHFARMEVGGPPTCLLLLLKAACPLVQRRPICL